MKKVLLSEGSSLTSRETLNILKNDGYIIDILSSAKGPITLFSTKGRRIYRVTNLNEDPVKHLHEIDCILKHGYDFFLTTHENSWFFSAVKEKISEETNVVLAPVTAFDAVQGKVDFAKLLSKLEIPQPRWQEFNFGDEVNISFPLWVKINYSTAGTGVEKVASHHEFDKLIHKYEKLGEKILLQENIVGNYGQVEAVFNHGCMVGVHTSMQTFSGVGGSAAARISINCKETSRYIERIGKHLEWTGCLTLDFIYSVNGPVFIECNPRLVEPGNGAAAGVDFPQLMIDIASGKQFDRVITGRVGIKTHNMIAVILGSAQTGKRREVFKNFIKCIFHIGTFKDSIETMTPIKNDYFCIVAISAVLLKLLINPNSVNEFVNDALKNYVVEHQTVKQILSYNIDKYNAYNYY